MTIWHNTKLRDDDTPIFTVNDRIRLGDAVFDTMLAVNGEPIHAALHFKRLEQDAETMGIALPYDLKDIVRAARQVLQDSRLNETRAVVNTIVSRGPAERGLMPSPHQDPQIIVTAKAAPESFPPVKAVIARFVRRNEGSLLSQIKSANYGDNILAIQEAQEADANEAIMLNNAGHITCATTSNIFAVIGGRFYTPPLEDGVLNGVTRHLLMDRIDVIEKSLSEEDIIDADGLFLTNSVRGFVPITSLDGNPMPVYDAGIDQDFHLI